MSVKDEKLAALKNQHRTLDQEINEKFSDLSIPDEYIKWLKKRKLLCKDQIDQLLH